jgi:signal transduction histidine kinase
LEIEAVENFSFNDLKKFLTNESFIKLSNDLQAIFEGNVTVEVYETELNLIKSNGEPIYVLNKSFIEKDTSGRVTNILSSIYNISDLKRYISKLENNNKIFKEIAFKQSHVLRAPVARIKGLYNLMNEPDTRFDEKLKLIELIVQSCEELEQHFKEIVDVSTNQRNKL